MKPTETGLMSQKEKSYVQYCFQRNSRPAKGSVSFSNFFRDEKIEYNIPEAKKEMKMVLGMRVRRSRKWQRPSANSKTSSFEQKLVIEDLLGTISILKWMNLSSEGKLELEESVVSYFQSVGNSVIHLEKAQVFVREFLELSDVKWHSAMLKTLIANCSLFTVYTQFDSFLSPIKLSSESMPDIDLSPLWSAETGCSFGIYLLQVVPEISSRMLESLNISRKLPKHNSDEFIKLLRSSLPKEDRKKLDSITVELYKNGC